jgi:hypothetical protein
MRRYRATHPVYMEKRRARMRVYQRAYRLANMERVIFYGILERCNNPRAINYARYGGKGVKCLLHSHEDILTAIGPRPSLNHSIDRINPKGHYEINNIRWATDSQQRRNQHATR